MARRNSDPDNGEERPCRYTLTRDANKVTMIARCMECQGGAGLDRKQCLSGILKGLAQEFNVDSVVLSHYIETKYTEDSMQVLRMMVEVLQNLEQMGIREPYEEYFADDERLSSSQKNQQKSKCDRCQLKPDTVFSTLKIEFSNNVSGFYDVFNEFTKEVAARAEDNCNECIEATKGDMIFLFNRLEDFRAYVIHRGFKVIV